MATVEGHPIGRMFERWAASQPDRLAVRKPQAEASYGELNRRANQVAHSLARHTTGTSSAATLLGSDLHQLAAFIGTLKIGRRFVPINPRLPTERVRFVLDDSQAVVLMTDATHLQQAQQLSTSATTVINLDDLDASSSENPVESFPLETHTWIVYTSGTTGAPKGVLQNHRNLLHYLRVYIDGFQMSADDRLTTLFPFHVNGALHDILLTLVTGGVLCPWDAGESGFSGLSQWLLSERTTILSGVPTAFRQFVATLADHDRFPTLRMIRLWGEASYRRDFAAFQRHAADDGVLVNRIGASETGPVSWQFFRKDSVFEGNSLPVGRCTEGHEALLVDEHGRSVPVGEVGEIVVRSRFLSPGYWRRDEQTRAVFSDDTEAPGVRRYRTGDLARELPDGCLLPMGRRDSQVKIRGYRVETDEIEQALVSIAGIDDAVVVPRRDQAEEPRLVGYFVAQPDLALTVSAIRRVLAARLPDYMIPSAFVRLDAFPLAPNGKIAKRALPEPGRQRPALDTPYSPAVTPDERWLVGVWQEVLQLDEIGIDDPFFDLGGDSLRAAQVISRLIEKDGLRVPLRTVFESATVAALAKAVAIVKAEGATVPELVIRPLPRVPRP
jgi:amino acid adenylation domain-containing protein